MFGYYCHLLRKRKWFDYFKLIIIIKRVRFATGQCHRYKDMPPASLLSDKYNQKMIWLVALLVFNFQLSITTKRYCSPLFCFYFSVDWI